jgi:hypothetical protein
MDHITNFLLQVWLVFKISGVVVSGIIIIGIILVVIAMHLPEYHKIKLNNKKYLYKQINEYAGAKTIILYKQRLFGIKTRAAAPFTINTLYNTEYMIKENYKSGKIKWI